MTDKRIDALRSLALFANNLVPSRIMAHDFEPTSNDIYNLQADLLVMAKKFDLFVQATGEYLLDMGIVSGHDVRDHFTQVSENALSGNALYCIEAGITQRIEERSHA